MVVQLDVKKAFDHVDHRAAVKAMKLQGVSLFSMALIAAIWNGSCMKVRLGTVSSNKVRMNRGLPQGAPASPVITMVIELVLRDLIKSWIARKLAWRLDDFVLAAICYADDVVLVAASVAAAEVVVAEVIAKLKEVGRTVGAQKTHWTSFPKMTDKNIMVDGLAVLWEEVLEFVGSKVCLDGNVRHAIAHRTAQANKCLTNWRPVLRSSWLPRLLRLNVEKTTMWQAFFWSASVWTTIKTQRDKIASWSARMVANVIGAKEPPWMEMDQWWRLWHRTGHRWIEMLQHEHSGCHQRTYAQLGRSCCQIGLQRDLCEGLEVPRTSVVEMATAPLERSKEGEMVRTQNDSKSTGVKTWLLVKFPNSLEMQTVCRNLSKTFRVGCILLKTVEAGNRLRNVERALCRWSRVPRGPMRVRRDWFGCRCCLDDREKIVSERFAEHLLPLSLYKPIVTLL